MLKKTEINLDDVKTGILEEKEEEKELKKKKKEVAYQSHEPASFPYKIVSFDPSYNHEIEIYSGENAAEEFLDSLQRDADFIYKKYIKNIKKMDELTEEENAGFDTATTCYICKKDFTDDNIKVHDHCHLTGAYRGAAHNNCNLNYNLKPNRWKLPCFFHNLRGYDGYLIIKALQKRHGAIRLIPNNMEKFLAMGVGQLQFLDSMQFTGGESLDNLTKTLNGDKEFHYTKLAFPVEEEFKLVKKKGIFPYDFFDDIGKLKYDKFPTREKFFNTLGDKECSTKDYLHAKLVWEKFKCNTFKDYHDI